MRVALGTSLLVLLQASLAAGQSTPIREPPPLDSDFKKTAGERSRQEAARRAYEEAASTLQKQAYETAGAQLDAFLQNHFDSADAPEAGYKLAICYLLQDKPDDAKRIFDRIVQDYFQSAWAQVILRAHYDEEALFKFAGAKRTEKSARLATDAVTAFTLYQRRTKDKKNQQELIYRMGDCFDVLGETQKHDEAMQAVQKHDKDGVWGKLAAIRLGGPEVFRKHMDELINLDASKQQFLLFLQLADRYVAALSGEERVKCEFYKACSHDADRDKRAAVLRGIVRDHPTSPWAAEAAFWLAEAEFSERRHAEARQAYLNFVKTYPKSPRVSQAQRWGEWLGSLDETSSELQKILDDTFARVSAGKGGLAIALRHQTESKKDRLLVRLAYQGDNLLVDIRVGEEVLLFANNAQGTWYHGSANNAVLRVPQRMKVPGLATKLDGDPERRNLSFLSRVCGENEQSTIQISPRATEAMMSYLQVTLHFHKEIVQDQRGQSCTRFRFESPVWNSQALHTIEVWVNDAGRICRGQVLWPGEESKESQLLLDDIAIGDPLPDSAFAVQVPAGLPVREVEEINPFDVLTQGMRMLSMLWNRVQKELEKK